MRLLRPWLPGRIRSLFRPAVELSPKSNPDHWLRTGFKWHLDRVQATDDGLSAHGWFAAPNADCSHLVLAVNGEPFPRQSTYPRPDVPAATPALRRLSNFGVVGLSGQGWNSPAALRPGAWLRLEVLDRRTGRPAPGLGRPSWYRVPSPHDPPVPGPERMIRVGGHDTSREFLDLGVQTFGTLQDALRSATGTAFPDYPRILDWGCGCGRVARYFADLPVRITGVDIDADNVTWCAANLTFGRFETVPLHPPISFPDASFDLAFGTSVFTHLAEPVQFEWLAELRRVVRPGGILLLSFLGDAATAVFDLTAEQVRRRDETGFLDLVRNKILDGYLPEEDYYRDVFHSADYVRREWGRYFEVIDLLPGGLTVQDLAVLRRR